MHRIKGKKTYLHGDGQTLPEKQTKKSGNLNPDISSKRQRKPQKIPPYSVSLIRPTSLSQSPSGGLVGNPIGQTLIKRVAIPSKLGIGIVQIGIGKDHGSEGRIGSIGDETINTIGKIVVHTLQNRGKMKPSITFVCLGVELDVTSTRTENILPIIIGNIGRCSDNRPTTIPSRLAVSCSIIEIENEIIENEIQTHPWKEKRETQNMIANMGILGKIPAV